MADKKFIEIKVGTGNSKKQVDDLDRSMVNLGRDTDKTVDIMGALSKVAVAVTAALSVSQVIAYGDAWTVVNNKLANSIRTGEQLVDVTQRVFDISQETRSSLDATATLYARLERATREYNVSAEELTQITKTINQGFIVSGATAQEAENAVIQLAQGLSAGALRGEEFNSVNEQGNRIIVALSASLGVSVGKMRELAAQGKLTTDVVVKGLLEQKDVIENEFNNTITTFSQNTQKATDNLTKFLGESTLVASSISILGDSMVLASENMDTFTDIAAILATLYIARLIPSAAQYATGLYATIAAQTKATVTTNAYGQVIARTTLATNAATVAVGALRAGLALLGGPLGVLFIAATSLVYMYTELETAEEKAEGLRTEVDLMSASFKNLNQEQRAIEVSKLNTQMSELRQQLIKANTALNNWTETAKTDPFANQKVRQYKNEVEGLNEQLNELSKRQQAVFQSGLPELTGTPGDTDSTSPPATSDVGSKQLEKERMITEQLSKELEFRRQNFSNYQSLILQIDRDTFEKRRLTLEARVFAEKYASDQELSDTLVSLEAKRQALAENEKILADDRRLLTEEFNAQEVEAELLHQQRMTEINAQAAADRRQISQDEFNSSLSIYQNYTNAALKLGEAFGSKSEKANKKRRKIGVIVDTAAGIARAYAENNFYVATGMAALLAANGAAQIAAINSASGTPTAPSTGGSTTIPSGGASSPSGQTRQEAPTQIFDLRGITADTLLTGQSLIDILSQTEGVAVALDGVMQEGRRLGEIS